MNKTEKYRTAFRMIQSVVEGENDMVANMANMAALLHEKFGFGKGVCGTAWERSETVIVPDVHQFPGHIACSSASNSEIVVPVFQNSQVIAVLDIDSTEFNTFDNTDKEWLEKIVSLIR